jgi:hypothetical protein
LSRNSPVVSLMLIRFCVRRSMEVVICSFLSPWIVREDMLAVF